MATKRARRVSMGVHPAHGRRDKEDVVVAENSREHVLLHQALTHTVVRVHASTRDADTWYYHDGMWFTRLNDYGDYRLGSKRLDDWLTEYVVRNYQDTLRFHLHVVLPREYRLRPDVEPIGWGFMHERSEEEGPPPGPPDDMHVMTIKSEDGKVADPVEETVFSMLDGKEGVHITLREIRAKLLQFVVNLILPTLRRRRAAFMTLSEMTTLPMELLSTNLVPYIDYQKIAQPAHHTLSMSKRRPSTHT